MWVEFSEWVEFRNVWVWVKVSEWVGVGRVQRVGGCE